jgi:hypothetical protein
MVWYEDLKPYVYWDELTIPEILNVGWLSKTHDFPKGTVPEALIEKLEQILPSRSNSYSQFIVNVMRGFFHCEFCSAMSDEMHTRNETQQLFLGHSDLLIPHAVQDGCYFIAPTLVYHYITAHSYQPPQPFIDAVLKLDFQVEYNGTSIIKNLLESRGRMYVH